MIKLNKAVSEETVKEARRELHDLIKKKTALIDDNIKNKLIYELIDKKIDTLSNFLKKYC